MGKVGITLKVMPVSPDVDMAKLRENVEKKVVEIGGMFREAKEEPIAFGLKALVCIIIWPEDKDPDAVETELAKVKDVNSINVIDVRRLI